MDALAPRRARPTASSWSRRAPRGDHSERVARYAGELGRALGLPPQHLRRLVHAARLHDVGKESVPDRILLKPGRLTKEEFAVVRQHSTVGERMVRAAGEADIATWIRHHHERWDGSGYPDGIAGTDIPLESRILAAVDSLDAMTTHRSYSMAITFEDAAREIEANAGTQFDPEVARVLVEMIDEESLPA